MRLTTNYRIPVPEDRDSADVPTTVGATADSVDAALFAAVAEAKAAALRGQQAALFTTYMHLGS